MNRKRQNFRLLVLLILIFFCTVEFQWPDMIKDLVQRRTLSSSSFNYDEVESNSFPNAMWSVHCFLPATEARFTLKHQLAVKSIQLNIKPDILYLHFTDEKQFASVEWQKIVEKYFNIETNLVSQNKAPLTTRDQATITQSFGGGMIVDLSVIVHKVVSRSEARSWCMIDRNLTILFMFAHCPYYTNTSLFDNCINGDPACSDFLRSLSSRDPTSSSLMLRWDDAAESMFVFERHDDIGISVYEFFSVQHFAQPWYDIARILYCDGCTSFEPERHPEPVVPNIAHFIWFDDRWNMSFLQMVSVSSALQVLKAERVFVHCNIEPTGPYWTSLRTRHPTRLVWSILPKFTQVWHVKLNKKYPHANTDVARLYVLKKHGGVFLDLDIIVLRSHDELRHYDAVVGNAFGHMEYNLQTSHLLFSRKSSFLTRFMEAYKGYDGGFLWTAVVLPMRIYRMHPYSIRIEPTFTFCPRMSSFHQIFQHQLDATVREQLRQAYVIEFTGAMPMLAYTFVQDVPQFGFHLLKENTTLAAILRLAIDGEALIIETDAMKRHRTARK